MTRHGPTVLVADQSGLPLISIGGVMTLDDLWTLLWDDLRHNATGRPSGAAIIARHRPAIEAELRASLAEKVRALPGVPLAHPTLAGPGLIDHEEGCSFAFGNMAYPCRCLIEQHAVLALIEGSDPASPEAETCGNDEWDSRYACVLPKGHPTPGGATLEGHDYQFKQSAATPVAGSTIPDQHEIAYRLDATLSEAAAAGVTFDARNRADLARLAGSTIPDRPLDVERLARAIMSEVEVDMAHGFPAGFGSEDLAMNIIGAYNADPR